MYQIFNRSLNLLLYDSDDQKRKVLWVYQNYSQKNYPVLISIGGGYDSLKTKRRTFLQLDDTYAFLFRDVMI